MSMVSTEQTVVTRRSDDRRPSGRRERRPCRREEVGLTELVERARAEDAAAWDEIVRRYSAMVRARVVEVGLTPTQADDAVQLTWIRLSGSLDELRDPEALGGWLRTTARNTAISLARTERRLTPGTSFDQPDQAEPSTDTPVDAGLLRTDAEVAVRAAVTALTDRQRDLVRLRYLDDETISYEELAARLGMPRGAVGPTLVRALHRMRRHPMIARLR